MVGCASGGGSGTRDCAFEPEELDGIALDKSEIIACLEARKAHLDCALALECCDFLGWWNRDAAYFCEEERNQELLTCPWMEYY